MLIVYALLAGLLAWGSFMVDSGKFKFWMNFWASILTGLLWPLWLMDKLCLLAKKLGRWLKS